MKSTIRQILLKTEGKRTIADIFHEKTKNKKIINARLHKMPEDWTKVHFKTYPRFAKRKLQILDLPKEIKNIFIKRRSIRNFSSEKISFSDLSSILFYSAGVVESANDLNNSRRPYPSAGARYPLEIYVFSMNIKDLDKGLYHYNLKENSLELLVKERVNMEYREAIGNDKNLSNASCAIIITAVWDRNRIKYGDRGYRYILLESGHLAQNILLISHFLGLGACAIGGFVDSKLNKFLDIENQKEVSLYIIALGAVR